MKKKKKLALASAVLLSALSQQATACGSQPYLGEICIFGFNFCPVGFAQAAGQLMSISQNTALFSLLGTYYGGNGTTTFALPDLRGRAPVGSGQGPGLSSIVPGQVGGSETVTLTVAQLPAHTHSAQLNVASANGDTDVAASAVPARLPRSRIYSSGTPDATMKTGTVTVGSTGGSQPVSVRDPFLGLTYCIAIQGIFPSRN
jgi:microcystin-dependent protein